MPARPEFFHYDGGRNEHSLTAKVSDHGEMLIAAQRWTSLLPEEALALARWTEENWGEPRPTASHAPVPEQST